ncbi:MAG: hypothetical protein QG652_1815 [Pseudomonadota bacterium]|nr:hypothetical protein [Pseudomonadota bacterium]
MKNSFLNVLTVSIALLALGFFLSWYLSDSSRMEADLPWQIETLPDGSIRVFRIQPGATRLGEFEHHSRAQGELTLFVPVSGEPVIEAYFDSVTMAGIKAKMVLLLNVDRQTIDAMYNRGARISTLGSGARKVTLHSDDTAALRNFIISGITYIPAIDLDAELLQKRFGTPVQKIKDSNNNAVHWLYPDKGLDIALNENDREVLQYVHPKDFNRITAPLENP